MITGTHTSASERELETLLSKLKLELVSCSEHKPLFYLGYAKKVSRRDLINYCFYLEQLTHSGISVVDALLDLQTSMSPSYISEVIGVQVREIRDGKTFSETLKGFPQIFSSTFVSLIEAGEKSGELPHVLKDLTETLTWQDELISQTKKALTLPSFIFVVVFAVVFFLMTFLVPQLVSFITMMGEELPLHTQILIKVSDFFVTYWPGILASPFIVFISLKHAIKTNPKVRFLCDKNKLKIWVFGPIINKIILARFSNYFALLYNSGIPVIESLKISEGIVDNKAMEQALINIRNLIAEGATVGQAFEMGELFPRLVISMINVGEKTGELGTSLQNVSYFYKRDVDDAIDGMQAVIEPAMTVVLGLIIGWVMVSVLGPIYDLITNIKM